MPLHETEIRQVQQQAGSPLREATVLDPPLTAAGMLRVELDAAPGVAHECPWVSRFEGSPVAKDAAAVLESDEGNWWAFWWPQNGQAPAPPTEVPPALTVGLRADRPAPTVIGALYYATDNGITYRSDGVAAWTAVGWAPLRVTALPTLPAPEEGQMVTFAADAANGVNWQLRYRAAVAKWELVGGSSLRSAVIVNNNWTSPAAFGWTAIPGSPSVTVPVAGDYEVEWFATGSGAVATNLRTRPTGMTANIPAAVALGSTAEAASMSGKAIMTLTAGQALGLQASSTINNTTYTFWERSIWIRPVRVG